MLAALLVLMPVLIGVWYVAHYGVNIAWEDEFFSMTPLFQKWFGGTLHVADFWVQHTEHRHFLPRLTIFLMGLATGWNTKFEIWLIQALLAVSLGTIILAVRRSCRIRHWLWLAVPPAWLVLTLRQHQNLLFGWQLNYMMAAAWSWITLALLASLNDGRRTPWKFGGAVLSATLGATAAAHGLLLWIVGVLPLLLLPEAQRRKRLTAAWVVVGLAEWGFYFIGYHGYIHPIGPVQERTLGNCSEYFTTLVGGSLFPLPTPAKWLGLLLLAIGAVTFGLVVAQRSMLQCTFWLTVATFGLLTQAEVAWGRTPFGNDQAMSSRYATFSLFVIVGVYGALATLLAGRAGSLASRGGKFLTSLIAWSAGAILLVLIACGIGLSCWEGVQAGADLKTRMNYHAFVFLTADSQPDEALRFAPWEDVAEIRHNLALLREHRLNIFAPSQAPDRYALPAATLPTVSAPSGLQVIPRFTGPLVQDFIYLNRSGTRCRLYEPFAALFGYAFDGGGQERLGGVVLEIDGVAYRAYYGPPRYAANLVAKNPTLGECGFCRDFSPRQLPAGRHYLTIRLLKSDGGAYFAAGPPQPFQVPEWPK